MTGDPFTKTLERTYPLLQEKKHSVVFRLSDPMMPDFFFSMLINTPNLIYLSLLYINFFV